MAGILTNQYFISSSPLAGVLTDQYFIPWSVSSPNNILFSVGGDTDRGGQFYPMVAVFTDPYFIPWSVSSPNNILSHGCCLHRTWVSMHPYNELVSQIHPLYFHKMMQMKIYNPPVIYINSSDPVMDYYEYNLIFVLPYLC